MQTVEQNVYDLLMKEDIKSLEQYMKSGLDVNTVFTCCYDKHAHGQTLLNVAALEKSMKVVKFLIDKKCDVNRVYEVRSCEAGISKVTELRQNDKLHKTCLYQAICSENTELVNQLVRAGADVNLYDGGYCTAIWHAVDTDNDEIIEAVLSSKNIDVNSQDRLKISPLHVSVIRKNPSTMLKLLESDAFVDIRQCQGASPLSLACSMDFVESVRILLQHGASPNLQNQDGSTPLCCAIDKGQSIDIVYLLLYAGGFAHSKFLPKAKYLSAKNEPMKMMLRDYIDTPAGLKELASLNIKQTLRDCCCGRSIYKLCGNLPLPRPLLNYLQMNKT